VCRFPEECVLESVEVDIGVKDYQATVPPTQLQAKTLEQLVEKWKVVLASIICHFQRIAKMDDTAEIVRLGKCHWRGIGVRPSA
jgi:hypothetical protein